MRRQAATAPEANNLALSRRTCMAQAYTLEDDLEAETQTHTHYAFQQTSWSTDELYACKTQNRNRMPNTFVSQRFEHHQIAVTPRSPHGLDHR